MSHSLQHNFMSLLVHRSTSPKETWRWVLILWINPLGVGRCLLLGIRCCLSTLHAWTRLSSGYLALGAASPPTFLKRLGVGCCLSTVHRSTSPRFGPTSPQLGAASPIAIMQGLSSWMSWMTALLEQLSQHLLTSSLSITSKWSRSHFRLHTVMFSTYLLTAISS